VSRTKQRPVNDHAGPSGGSSHHTQYQNQGNYGSHVGGANDAWDWRSPLEKPKTSQPRYATEFVQVQGILKEELDRFPDIYMSRQAFNKLKGFIDHCKLEISGVGIVEVMKNGDINIQDILLLDQECTSGTTDIDPEALFALLGSIDDPAKIKVWWHSHVDMAVFWSGTDEDTIKNFSQTGWFISIVGNKKGQFLCRLDMYPSADQPLRIGVDNCGFTVYEQHEPDVEHETYVRALIEQHVRPKSYAPAKATTYPAGNHHGGPGGNGVSAVRPASGSANAGSVVKVETTKSEEVGTGKNLFRPGWGGTKGSSSASGGRSVCGLHQTPILVEVEDGAEPDLYDAEMELQKQAFMDEGGPTEGQIIQARMEVMAQDDAAANQVALAEAKKAGGASLEPSPENGSLTNEAFNFGTD
jgi:hypothetical protein